MSGNSGEYQPSTTAWRQVDTFQNYHAALGKSAVSDFTSSQPGISMPLSRKIGQILQIGRSVHRSNSPSLEVGTGTMILGAACLRTKARTNLISYLVPIQHASFDLFNFVQREVMFVYTSSF